MTIQPLPLEDLSSAELRLELAEAEYEKPKTWKAGALKKKRISAITAVLVERGAF